MRIDNFDKGLYKRIRYNTIQDITAKLLREIMPITTLAIFMPFTNTCLRLGLKSFGNE